MDFSIISDIPLLTQNTPKTVQFVFAENGSLHEYPYSKFISSLSTKDPSALMEFIDKEFGLPQADQVILRAHDGKQLELTMNLKEFLEKDQVLHVFNTRFYRDETISDDFEVICPPLAGKNEWSELGLGSLSEIYETYLGPEIKAGMDPDLSVKLEEIMATFCDVQNEITLLKDGSVKLKRQKDSETVVKKNLMDYYVEKKKKFDETFSQMKTKILAFQNLLENFDSCLDKLSKTEIDPNIADKGKKYLIDYFDLDKVKGNKLIYEKNQSKIMLKCQEMEEEILEYDKQLMKMEESIPNYYLEITELIGAQEAKLMEIQEMNTQGFRNLLDEKNCKFSMHDFCIFVNREWETNIPKLREIFQNLQQIRVTLDGYLKDNAIKLKNFVSDVANIQLIIRGKLYNKHTVFRSLVEKHEKDLSSLETVVEFPSIYQVSVEEIQRRSRAKRDCFTLLNIFENFIDTENNLREEFSKKYNAYLPKSFCPFLTKSFPRMDFEYLRRVVHQDSSPLLNQSGLLSSRTNESGEVLKLLKSFSATIQTKETRIQELEDLLRVQKEELKNFREQSRPKTMESIDLNQLLKDGRFQEQVENLMKKITNDCQERISTLSDRLNLLRMEGIQPFEETIKDITQEVKAELTGSDKPNVVELIREMKKTFERNTESLKKELEDNSTAKEKLMSSLQEMNERMERVAMEREEAIQRKTEIAERVKMLNERLCMVEKKEKDQENIITMLQQNLNINEETIISLNGNLKEKQEEVETRNNQLNELDQLYTATTVAIAEKEKVIEDCRIQVTNLWEKIAEKDNQIDALKKTLEPIAKDMQSLRMQNEQLNELVLWKEKLLDEIQINLKDKQSKIKSLEKQISTKEKDLDAVNKNLSESEERFIVLKDQKTQLESEFRNLKDENFGFNRETKNLTRKIKTLEEKMKAMEATKSESEASLANRLEEIGKLKQEKKALLEECKANEKEKTSFIEKIREEITQEFLPNISKLEDILKAKDQEIKRLQQMASNKERSPQNSVSKKDLRMSNSKDAAEDVRGSCQESKNISPEAEYRENALQSDLLGEFGEATLELYTTLLGRHAKEVMNNKQLDLKEIIGEIPKLIRNSTIKVQDLAVGDKVMGMRIPGFHYYYQLVFRDEFNSNVLYLFKAKEDYGGVLVGVVKTIDYAQEKQHKNGLMRRFKLNGVLEVELADIETICLVGKNH